MKAADFWRAASDPETYNNTYRKDIFREEFNGIIVDTCDSPDCGWETGIARKDGHFIIVEEYDGRDLAEIGHKKWVKSMQENPDQELSECRDPVEWFFG